MSHNFLLLSNYSVQLGGFQRLILLIPNSQRLKMDAAEQKLPSPGKSYISNCGATRIPLWLEKFWGESKKYVDLSLIDERRRHKVEPNFLLWIQKMKETGRWYRVLCEKQNINLVFQNERSYGLRDVAFSQIPEKKC